MRRLQYLLIPLAFAVAACGDKAEDTASTASGQGSGDESAGEDGADDGSSTGDEGDSGDSGDGGDGGDEGGTDDTGTDWCDGQPTATYNNFGRSFMTENCQGCHASTAVDRYGAPESVSFDTVDECWAWKSRVLERSTGEDPSMPPSGGVQPDDRTLLEIWLTCAEKGT